MIISNADLYITLDVVDLIKILNQVKDRNYRIKFNNLIEDKDGNFAKIDLEVVNNEQNAVIRFLDKRD